MVIIVVSKGHLLILGEKGGLCPSFFSLPEWTTGPGRQVFVRDSRGISVLIVDEG